MPDAIRSGPGCAERGPGRRPREGGAVRNVVRSSRLGGTQRGIRSGRPSARSRPSGYAAGAQESPPQVFPGRLQPGGAADALLGVRKKVTGPLPGRVQLRDRLVEVDADPPHQQRSPVQGVEGVPQRRIRYRDLAPCDRQSGFGGYAAPARPGEQRPTPRRTPPRSARTAPSVHAAPDTGSGGAAGRCPSAPCREPRRHADQAPRACPFSLPARRECAVNFIL